MYRGDVPLQQVECKLVVLLDGPIDFDAIAGQRKIPQ